MFKFSEDLIILEKLNQFDEDVHKCDLLLKFSHVKFF